MYLVPLWHNELYFDGKDGSEIIVLCQPKIRNNERIDENNNIHVTKEISIENELSDIILNNQFVSIEVGGKWFTIPINELLMKKEQIYRFKGQGISHVIEKDLYNISAKGDVVVKIILKK
jgi:hypothetical protein